MCLDCSSEKGKSEKVLSHVQLLAIPWTGSLAPLCPMGFSNTRVLERFVILMKGIREGRSCLMSVQSFAHELTARSFFVWEGKSGTN